MGLILGWVLIGVVVVVLMVVAIGFVAKERRRQRG